MQAEAEWISNPLIPMARVTGLEPATSGVTGRHSNQLSYTRIGSGLEDEGLGAAAPAVKRD